MTEQWPPPRREPPYENQPFQELGPMPTNPVQGYPGYPGGRPAEPEPPIDVVTAVQLWWAVAILGVLQGGAMIAVILGRKSMFVDEMMKNPAAAEAGLTRSEVDAMFPLVIGVCVVMIVVVTAVFLLFVRSMSRGKNWARMLLTFGGVFMVVSAIPVFTGLGDGGGAMLLLGGAQILQAVAAVGAIVMMHRRDSNPYFLRFPPAGPGPSSGVL
ncbi:hypothetical protein ABH922_003441 [Rhodococcus sp. 27YEA15]|uniref:hypothetical protein n=1 Tax=Rhodococcus sp. 27YEA15 TaxID=3156259 RepID=UPI003C7B75D2